MKFEVLKKDNWCWEVSSEFLSGFSSQVSFWEKIEEKEQAKILRTGTRELWLELRLEDSSLPGLLWARVRDYSDQSFPGIRPDRPRLKGIFNLARQIYSRVPVVPAPIAYGRKRKNLRVIKEIMLFESLTHLKPLPDYLKENFLPREVEFHPLDKREKLSKFARLWKELFSLGIYPVRNLKFENLLVKAEGGELQLFFPQPEHLKISHYSPEKEMEALAWLSLELRAYASRPYWLRFFREYLKGSGAGREKLSIWMEKLSPAQVRIVRSRFEQARKDLWKRREGFFWFEHQQRRIFLRQLVSQNQVIGLLDDFPLLFRKGGKVRIRLVGEREPRECQLVEIERDQEGELGASSGFFLSRFLELQGIAHQLPVIGVEPIVKKGLWQEYLIYLPLGASAVSLNEYFARLLADELSGSSWDRRFLLQLAHYLLGIFDAGLIFIDPRGDEVWIEEEDRLKFYLTHLERIKRPTRASTSLVKNSLFNFLWALPLSEPDALLVLEEVLRYHPALKNKKGECLEEFQSLMRGVEK